MIYRRPKGLLLNDFINDFSRFSHAFQNIILSVDLNCNLLANNFEARHLRNFVLSLSLFLVQSTATFHATTTDSWLDVIIIDDEHKLLFFGKSDAPLICGHDLISITFAFDIITTEPHTISWCSLRHFNSANDSTFVASTTPQSPPSLATTSNPLQSLESCCDLLSRSILQALDLHAPLRVFPFCKPRWPWISDALKARIKHRSRLYKQAKRSNNLLDLAVYRHYRDQLTVDLRSARQDYQLNRLSGIKDPTRLWRKLGILGLVKLSFSSQT